MRDRSFRALLVGGAVAAGLGTCGICFVMALGVSSPPARAPPPSLSTPAPSPAAPVDPPAGDAQDTGEYRRHDRVRVRHR